MYDQETVPMRELGRRPNSRRPRSKSQIFMLVSIVILLAALLGGGITLFMISPQFAPVGSVTGSPTNSSGTRTGATTTPASSTPIATATQVQPAPSPTQIANLPHILHATFTLDHVTVNIASPLLPGTFSAMDKPDEHAATATTPDLNAHPWGAVYIIAVPYGTQPTSEGVPIARPGGAQAYRDFLYHYRTNNGDNPQTGPTATLFGQKIAGIASMAHGSPNVAYSSTVIVEWVVEAGNRIWIIRITEEQADLTSATSFLASLRDLKLSSGTLSNPT